MNKLLSSLLIAALYGAAMAQGADFKSFWLTEAISGKTIGPIVNKPGNRFKTSDGEWIVMQSARGEINFATAKSLETFGPYSLVEQRLIDLGPKAYVFTQITDYTGTTPEKDESTISQAIRAPAQWRQNLPERWVLAPVPSTNPGAYRETKTWSASSFQTKPEIDLWFDLLWSREYDWELGGMSSSEKTHLKTDRIVVSGKCSGFELDLGYMGFFAKGKSSGNLSSDNSWLSGLKISNGTGTFLRGGYAYALSIDNNWYTSIGLFGSFMSLDADVSASTTRRENPATTEELDVAHIGSSASYIPAHWKSGAKLREYRVNGEISVGYEEWYWGVSGSFILEFINDTSVGVNVPVRDTYYKLSADASQEVGIALSGWYSPDDKWMILGSATFGAEYALRVGIGYYF